MGQTTQNQGLKSTRGQTLLRARVGRLLRWGAVAGVGVFGGLAHASGTTVQTQEAAVLASPAAIVRAPVALHARVIAPSTLQDAQESPGNVSFVVPAHTLPARVELTATQAQGTPTRLVLRFVQPQPPADSWYDQPLTVDTKDMSHPPAAGTGRQDGGAEAQDSAVGPVANIERVPAASGVVLVFAPNTQDVQFAAEVAYAQSPNASTPVGKPVDVRYDAGLASEMKRGKAETGEPGPSTSTWRRFTPFGSFEPLPARKAPAPLPPLPQ